MRLRRRETCGAVGRLDFGRGRVGNMGHRILLVEASPSNDAQYQCAAPHGLIDTQVATVSGDSNPNYNTVGAVYLSGNYAPDDPKTQFTINGPIAFGSPGTGGTWQ